MDVTEQLNEKFSKLDDMSKLTIAMQIFSQCSYGHRRFHNVSQLQHGHDYIFTDDALRAAEEVNPSVATALVRIRELLEEVVVDPPTYMESDLRPTSEALTREFLWSNGFDEPVWYDIRQVARNGMRTLEGRARAIMASADPSAGQPAQAGPS